MPSWHVSPQRAANSPRCWPRSQVNKLLRPTKHQNKNETLKCEHTTLTHACRVKVLHAGCQTYGSVKTARVTRKHGVTTMNPCAVLAAQLMCKTPTPTPATHIWP